MAEEKKRVNFTLEDQDTLLALVSKEPDLACMKTDSRTIALKKAVWERITEKFNNAPSTQTIRTDKQLVKLWNNIKNRRKSHLADNKRKSLQTGGGVIECTIVENPNIEMVLGNVDYEISAAMDSDTVSVPVHSQLENKRKRYDLPSSSYELEQLAKEEEIEEMLYEATPTLDATSVTPQGGENEERNKTRASSIEELTQLQMNQMRELHKLKMEKVRQCIATSKAEEDAAKAKEAYFKSKRKKFCKSVKL